MKLAVQVGADGSNRLTVTVGPADAGEIDLLNTLFARHIDIGGFQDELALARSGDVVSIRQSGQRSTHPSDSLVSHAAAGCLANYCAQRIGLFDCLSLVGDVAGDRFEMHIKPSAVYGSFAGDYLVAQILGDIRRNFFNRLDPQDRIHANIFVRQPASTFMGEFDYADVEFSRAMLSHIEDNLSLYSFAARPGFEQRENNGAILSNATAVFGFLSGGGTIVALAHILYKWAELRRRSTIRFTFSLIDEEEGEGRPPIIQLEINTASSVDEIVAELEGIIAACSWLWQSTPIERDGQTGQERRESASGTPGRSEIANARIDQSPGKVFISYVREDSERVDRLVEVLEEAGVHVWRDNRDLKPGQDWNLEIRRIIEEHVVVFIACFSQASDARDKSYQREELILASEQMRLRRLGQVWIIPIRFDECTVPGYDLGAGRDLSRLNRVDLFDGNWQPEILRLIDSVRAISGIKSVE